jgi:hypothetical protein
MTSFQEFLHKKAEEQRVLSRRDLRDEWIEAVNRLILQIDQWLAEADPEGVLDRIDMPYEKAEKGLGRYTVHGLQIGLGDLAVQVIPVARNVVGSPRLQGDGASLAGRVDLSNGIKKYILRRVLKGDEESWEVADEHFGAEPLSRAELESILQDLLA